jgi:hypothetical protein
MQDDQRLRIHIQNTKPIELVDLTGSFFSIADEYERFVLTEHGELKREDIKLYVQEIKTGSITADLVGGITSTLPIIQHLAQMVPIIIFAQYLKRGYDYLLGRTTEKPNLKKANYKNFSGFVEPIAKDSAAQININTVQINQNPIFIFNLSSLDANAAQNAAQREIGLLREPSTGLNRNVVLYWYQAKKDMISQTGNRVIIESIYPFPVKVIFDNETVKSAMLLGTDNPFTSAYVVDVAVETIGGKPILYKILNMHERIEILDQMTIES